MKAPTSFDHTIANHHFTFARVCTNAGDCEHYSVMADDHVFRITKAENGTGYRIPDTDGLPEEILELELQLSDILMAHDAKENAGDE